MIENSFIMIAFLAIRVYKHIRLCYTERAKQVEYLERGSFPQKGAMLFLLRSRPLNLDKMQIPWDESEKA